VFCAFVAAFPVLVNGHWIETFHAGTKRLREGDWSQAERLLSLAASDCASEANPPDHEMLSVLHNNLGLATFLVPVPGNKNARIDRVQAHFDMSQQYASMLSALDGSREVRSMDALLKNRAWLQQTLNDKSGMEQRHSELYDLILARRDEPIKSDGPEALSVYDIGLSGGVCAGSETGLRGGTPTTAYLDLVKRGVTNFLQEDLPHPMMPVVQWDIFFRGRDFQNGGAPASGGVKTVATPARANMHSTPGARAINPNFSAGITTVPKGALDLVQAAIERVLADEIPGDVIEAGVWRGGLAVLMRAALKMMAPAGSPRRLVWAADSFQGIPIAENDDEVNAWTERYAVDLESVRDNFDRYGLLDDGVVFLEGFFAESLVNAPPQLSLIHADADSYDSTMDILEQLYPRLSVGGYIIIDDFHLSGARQAVIDYRRRRGIFEPMLPIPQEYVMTCRRGSGTVLGAGELLEGPRSAFWRRSLPETELSAPPPPRVSAVIKGGLKEL
jgi:hypothetical protein